MQTNQERQISAEKQYRRIQNKIQRQNQDLMNKTDSTPRKLASPIYPSSPYNARAVRPTWISNRDV